MKTRIDAVAARAAKIAASLPFGPDTDPCICGHGRHSHAGNRKTPNVPATGKCSATDCVCRRYRSNIAHDMAIAALWAADRGAAADIAEYDRRERRKAAEKNPRGEGEWGVGPSDYLGCRRAIMYRERPPEDLVRLPEDKRAANMGTVIHAEVLRRRQALYPWRMYGDLPGMGIDIPGLDRQGHFDEYDPVMARVFDLKTKGSYAWEKIGEDGPGDSEWGQAMVYAYVLTLLGYPVKDVCIVALERAGGRDEVFTRPYSEEEALAALEWLISVNTALDAGVELPRDRSGPSTDKLCARCPFRITCWNMERAEELGRSPESLTILGEDPTDEQIEAAASHALVAAAQRLEAEKMAEAARDAVDGMLRKRSAAQVEDEAMALLQGLPEGTYGEVYVYEKKTTGRENHKAHAAMLLDYYDLPEDERPVKDTVLTAPRYRDTYKTSVKPMRKAARDKKARETPGGVDVKAAG